MEERFIVEIVQTPPGAPEEVERAIRTAFPVAEDKIRQLVERLSAAARHYELPQAAA